MAGASSVGTVTCASSLLKEVYNPKAVIPHAASLHQACAHCAIFPTAASRRSLGRISVPVWPDTLSGRLPVVALVGHHPTNKLIGRGPIPHRKSFPPPGHATSRVYSVLDPVSQAYPKVQGRSPTCYSPVRHSCTPKGLTVRLACVKHAASVRPEPESNSPNKNNIRNSEQGIRIRKIRPSKPEKNWQKNHATPQHGGTRMRQKNNNKQKPPNTLLSSQTTHPASHFRPRRSPAAFNRVFVVRTDERFEARRHSLRCRRGQRTNRVATTSLSYVRR